MIASDDARGVDRAMIGCGSEQARKDGQTRLGGQRWRCNDCGRRFTTRSTSAFSYHSFPDDEITLAVRWYVRYCLSYADVVEWFAGRGSSSSAAPSISMLLGHAVCRPVGVELAGTRLGNVASGPTVPQYEL